MNINQKVGKIIAGIRLNNNLSQEELAHRAKMNASYLAKVERGDINIGLKNLYKICKALKIKMSELLIDIK